MEHIAVCQLVWNMLIISVHITALLQKLEEKTGHCISELQFCCIMMQQSLNSAGGRKADEATGNKSHSQ